MFAIVHAGRECIASVIGGGRRARCWQVDHFDFSLVVPHLPLLEELELTYGVNNCGMNFDWDLFNFTNRDCLFLATCVQHCRTLKAFKLYRSKVRTRHARRAVVDVRSAAAPTGGRVVS